MKPVMAYEHIKNLMKERGDTQTDIGKIIGRTQAVVANLFEGRRSLQIREVELLAKHFRVSENFIMYGTEAKPNNLSDGEIALTDALKNIYQLMLHHDLATPESLSRTLRFQMESYQEKKLPNAVTVMQELLAYVSGEPPKTPEKDIIARLMKLPRK